MHDTIMPEQAQWIWLGDAEPNSYVGFARQFSLPPGAAPVTLSIFADTKYKLYVNGRFVNAGPVPFRKPICRVDRYDLGPWLTEGRNTLFILAHFVGVTVKYNTADRPGLIATLAIGDAAPIVTDLDWTCWRLSAWEPQTPRKNWAIEHVECISVADESFPVLCALAGEDYALGEPPPVDAILATGHTPTLVEAGRIQFRARELPPLRWRTEDAPLPIAIFRLNGEVYNLQDTPVRLDHEHVRPAWDQERYQMTRGGLLHLRRRRGDPGYGILYDMQRMCAGDISFQITVDSPCTLDLSLAEALRHGRPNTWRNGGLYFARFHLQPGLNRCRFYHFNGHRYIYLTVKDLEGTAIVHRVTTHHCRADLDFTDSFAADPVMEMIYAISRRSLMLNTQALSYDCNTREQGAYWGDNLWILDSVGHLTGNFAHLGQMCDAMTEEYAALGTLNASIYGLGAPLHDYCLIAVDFLRRYHAYTGDRAVVDRNLATAEAIVEDFRRLIDDSGFIKLGQPAPETSGFRAPLLFLDHPGLGWHPRTTTGIDRSDYNCGINLFYLQALQALDVLYRQTGRQSNLTEEIQAMQHRLRERFFIPDQGLLADAWHEEQHHVNVSQIVNCMGVMTGVLTGADAHEAMRRLVDTERYPWISQGTPYTYFFICEALSHLGLLPLAVETIRPHWIPMLERGATSTWEAFGGENHDSLNHAWSAPLPYLLRRGIIGLQPTTCGYATLRLEPAFAAFPSFSHTCRIPQGQVTVAWEHLSPQHVEVAVTLPHGVSGTLVCCGECIPIVQTLTTTIATR